MRYSLDMSEYDTRCTGTEYLVVHIDKFLSTTTSRKEPRLFIIYAAADALT